MSMFNLFKKDPVAVEKKKIDKNIDVAHQISKADGHLIKCRMFFKDVLVSESYKALERRERRISDAPQMERIHDAIIGLLAVEETGYELDSVQNARELNEAIKGLGRVMRLVGRMSPDDLIIEREDVKKMLGMKASDSTEPFTFSARAELVDKAFVNNMIDLVTVGISVEKALDQLLRATPAHSYEAEEKEEEKYDFTKFQEEKPANDASVVDKFNNMR